MSALPAAQIPSQPLGSCLEFLSPSPWVHLVWILKRPRPWCLTGSPHPHPRASGLLAGLGLSEGLWGRKQLEMRQKPGLTERIPGHRTCWTGWQTWVYQTRIPSGVPTPPPACLMQPGNSIFHENRFLFLVWCSLEAPDLKKSLPVLCIFFSSPSLYSFDFYSRPFRTWTKY